MKPLEIKANEIVDLPKMVAPLPYLNFLRFYRRKHPRMSMEKILQQAPAEWDALTRRQKNLFHKKVIYDKIFICQHLFILHLHVFTPSLPFQRILARIARFSRVQCLRLLLPRLKCHNNLDSTTRLKALHERKRYYRMKREQRERGRY